MKAGPTPAAPPGATSSQRALGIHDRKLVRTDPRLQTLHAFAVMPSSQGAMPSSQGGGGDTPGTHYHASQDATQSGGAVGTQSNGAVGTARGGAVGTQNTSTAVYMEVDEEGEGLGVEQEDEGAAAPVAAGGGLTQGIAQGVGGHGAAAAPAAGHGAAAMMHSTARRRGAARAAGPASFRYEKSREGYMNIASVCGWRLLVHVCVESVYFRVCMCICTCMCVYPSTCALVYTPLQEF